MADGSAAAGLPSSNRGVSEFRNPTDPGYPTEKFKGAKRFQKSGPVAGQGTGISIGIDWFAASVDLCAVLEFQGATGIGPSMPGGMPANQKRLLDGCVDGSTALEVAHHVFAFFFSGCGLSLADEAGNGRFYKSRVSIRNADGKHVGLIEMGGEATAREGGTISTARIELTGDGCRLYSAAGCGHAKRWLLLRAKLESCAGRLTRVDVCADDLLGLYPVRVAQQWWEKGEFDNRGQRPKAALHDDFDSGDGKTLNIGSRKSEKFMRVYEKGRQLGDVDSPWVRFEAEFKSSQRKELTLDILRDPAAYLLGAYPILKFIDAIASRIDVTDAAAAATWKSARRHIKRQYGATLHFILKNTPDAESAVRVIESLTSPKLPAWAGNDAANQWPEIVAVNEGNEQ